MEDLNRLYRSEPALYEQDFQNAGFEWVDFHDWEQGVVSFIRKARTTGDVMLVICNLTPVPRMNYRIGVPRGGHWQECLSSDASRYGGAGFGNFGGLEANPIPVQGRYHSLSATVPPLGTLFFKSAGSQGG